MSETQAKYDTPELDAMITSLGRKKPRTLLRDACGALSREDGQRLEASLEQIGAMWHHAKLVAPAVRAAYLMNKLAGAKLQTKLRALDADRYADASPAARIVSLTMTALAEPLDLDGGVAVPESDGLTLTRAFVAYFVQELEVTIADMSFAAAKDVWTRAELDPDTWQNRVKRLADAYEAKTYPNA